MVLQTIYFIEFVKGIIVTLQAKRGLTQSVSKAFMFEKRLKRVSNARRLKCNETSLHVF